MSSKSKRKKSKAKSRNVMEIGTIRQMNNMMNNHFNMMNSLLGASPFGMIEGPGRSEMVPYAGPPHRRMRDDFGMGLMPTMGMPGMRSVFQDMANSGNCHSFSQSTVMTMSSGPDGRPQIYQASSSMRQGPDGVKETRKAVADSRTGVKKMQIGHHIGERAHLVEREKNFRSGEAEQREEFINLDEEEADDFNREWQTKITGGRNANAIGYTDRRRQHPHHAPQHHQQALPSSSPSTSSKRGGEMKKKRPHEYDPENSQHYRKKNFKKSWSRGGGSSSDPIPVVEEPESDDDVQEVPLTSSKAPSSNTIIEELE